MFPHHTLFPGHDKAENLNPAMGNSKKKTYTIVYYFYCSNFFPFKESWNFKNQLLYYSSIIIMK